MADNTKTFKIKIDGLEQSVQYTKLLADSFLAVDRNIAKTVFTISQLRQGIQATLGASMDLNFVKSFSKFSSLAEATGKDLTKSFNNFNKELSTTSSLFDKITIEGLSKYAAKSLSTFKELSSQIVATVKDTSKSAEEETSKLTEKQKIR